MHGTCCITSPKELENKKARWAVVGPDRMLWVSVDGGPVIEGYEYSLKIAEEHSARPRGFLRRVIAGGPELEFRDVYEAPPHELYPKYPSWGF